jgi:hypothetical protein
LISSPSFSILLFRDSSELKLCVPASYQSLHSMLLFVFTKLITIVDLDCAIILVIVTLRS